jgi:hypothetical protein
MGAAGPEGALALGSDHRPGREGGPHRCRRLSACDALACRRRKPQGRRQTPKREGPPDGAGGRAHRGRDVPKGTRTSGEAIRLACCGCNEFQPDRRHGKALERTPTIRNAAKGNHQTIPAAGRRICPTRSGRGQAIGPPIRRLKFPGSDAKRRSAWRQRVKVNTAGRVVAILWRGDRSI